MDWCFHVKTIGGVIYYCDYDFKNSLLWKLRELRNYIAHEPIITRAGFVTRGVGTRGNYTELYFKFDWKNMRKHHFEETTDNPQKYFASLFNELLKFVEEIRNILPYDRASVQYKNQLDFDL